MERDEMMRQEMEREFEAGAQIQDEVESRVSDWRADRDYSDFLRWITATGRARDILHEIIFALASGETADARAMLDDAMLEAAAHYIGLERSFRGE